MAYFRFLKIPDFLIIGAQKAGTTTLYNCLVQHPQISMPKVKEVHYFDLNYDKGIGWYKEFFRTGKPFWRKIAGEASPYYFFHPLVPERVARHLPKVKLIVMLRNPIDRAYSHFYHEVKHNTEIAIDFQKAIGLEEQRIADNEILMISGRLKLSSDHQSFSYISRGLYAKQIERWLKYFPLSQMLFIKSEDFFKYPEHELVALYRFLGVKNILPEVITPQNVNTYPVLPDDLRKKLMPLFEEDANRLVKMIGEKFRW